MVICSDEELADRIRSLAAHIDAAMCEWLELVADFDGREAWGEYGALSCAHWLSWYCSISIRTAREHVRVARALGAFPLTTRLFRAGALSYSKVRAITRVGDVTDEADLLAIARDASAAQLDRTVRSYSRCVRSAQPDVERRFVALDEDEDGTWVLRGRLGAEEAAVVARALESLETFAEEPADGGSAEPPAPDVALQSRGERVADALVAMAGSVIAGGAREQPGGARAEVMVHVDVEALAGDATPGRCEVDGGGSLAAETARRLCCDAGIVVSTHRQGRVLDVGRRRRSIPPALARALRARDGGCQFPGCLRHRFVDAHHITHWARGGHTNLDNLVLLCRHHHRLVHEGGFTLERGRDGAIAVLTPERRRLTAVPRNRRGACADVTRNHRLRGVDPGPAALLPMGDGRRLDLGLAVEALLDLTPQASGPARGP
jgi:hypothetical protein